MELDITRFFNEACPMDYSASVAEIGRDAGKVTWSAAVEDAAEYSILPDEKAREAFRDQVKGFGASEYYRLSEKGQISGRMSHGDDGRVYYYIGD